MVTRGAGRPCRAASRRGPCAAAPEPGGAGRSADPAGPSGSAGFGGQAVAPRSPRRATRKRSDGRRARDPRHVRVSHGLPPDGQQRPPLMIPCPPRAAVTARRLPRGCRWPIGVPSARRLERRPAVHERHRAPLECRDRGGWPPRSARPRGRFAALHRTRQLAVTRRARAWSLRIRQQVKRSTRPTGVTSRRRTSAHGDRDRTRQDRPARLRIRRHRDRAVAAHA